MLTVKSMRDLKSLLKTTDADIRLHVVNDRNARLIIVTPENGAYQMSITSTVRDATLLPSTPTPDYLSLGARVFRQHDMKLVDGTTVRYDEVEPSVHERGANRYNQRIQKMVDDWPAEFVELRVTDPTLGSDSTATLLRSGNRLNRLSDMRQLTYYYVGGSRRSQADIDAHNRLNGAGQASVDTTEEIDEGW